MSNSMRKDKLAIQALTNAQSNVKTVLDRNEALEKGLASLIKKLENMKDEIPDTYVTKHRETTTRGAFNDAVDTARRIL